MPRFRSIASLLILRIMLLLPLLRLFVSGGPGWGEAVAAGQPVIAALDLAFVLAGAWLILQPALPHGSMRSSRMFPKAAANRKT